MSDHTQHYEAELDRANHYKPMLVRSLARATDQAEKRKIAAEINSITKYEGELAIALQKERAGQARLAEIHLLGRAAYAKSFERDFGEPL